MTFFQRFYVAIAFVLAVLVLLIAYLLRLPEGGPRLAAFFVAVAAFVLVCVLGNRSQARR